MPRLVLLATAFLLGAAPRVCEGEMGHCYGVYAREGERRAEVTVCASEDHGLGYTIGSLSGTTGEAWVTFSGQAPCVY